MPEWGYLGQMCGGQLFDHKHVHNCGIFMLLFEKSSSHDEHRFRLRCPIPIGEEALTRASQSTIWAPSLKCQTFGRLSDLIGIGPRTEVFFETQVGNRIATLVPRLNAHLAPKRHRQLPAAGNQTDRLWIAFGWTLDQTSSFSPHNFLRVKIISPSFV